jgi:hypothetical protein
MPSFQKMAIFLVEIMIGALCGSFVLASPGSNQQLASTAAKSPPQTISRRFNIVWHINTNVESLADPTPEQKSQIGQLRSLVNGYSFTFLAGGRTAYWPGRPDYCSIDKERPWANTVNYMVLDGAKRQLAGDSGLRTLCDRLFQQYADKIGGDAQERRAYLDAVGRVIHNLNLASEHAAGKTINARAIVNSASFSYSPSSDTVTVNSIPSLNVLAKSGIAVDSLFVYQEGAVFLKRMLQVPTTRGGQDVGYLPENAHLLGLLNTALHAYGHPVSQLQVNVRRWNGIRSPAMVNDLDGVATNFAVGFTFEGGVGALYRKFGAQWNVDNEAEGIGWILSNANNDVQVLMPAYWPCNDQTDAAGDTCTQTDNEDTRAALITDLDKFVTRLDSDLHAEGISGGVCTSRLSLIPGAYGAPMHPYTLPLYAPSGRPAGTVGGEIVELHNLRTRLCGG